MKPDPPNTVTFELSPTHSSVVLNLSQFPYKTVCSPSLFTLKESPRRFYYCYRQDNSYTELYSEKPRY